MAGAAPLPTRAGVSWTLSRPRPARSLPTRQMGLEMRLGKQLWQTFLEPSDACCCEVSVEGTVSQRCGEPRGARGY